MCDERRPRNTWAEYLLPIGVGLIGIGIVFTTHLDYPVITELVKTREILNAVADGAIVACLLALLVDRFLKQRLFKDVSRGLFAHMIGFDHEPELRAALKSIALETYLYQRDYRLTCHIDELQNGVKLTLSKEVDVVNQSLEKRTYNAGWRFTESDQPSDCKLTVISDSDVRVFTPDLKADMPGYLSAHEVVDIEPRVNKKRVRVVSSCSILQPSNWYHPMYFGHPTIDVTFTLSASPGLDVWIGGHKGDSVYHHSGLQMPETKLEIHWRKK